MECDLKLEHKAIPLLREAIAYCESVQDFVSRDLLSDILDNEEEHVDWLETQLNIINTIGIEKLFAKSDNQQITNNIRNLNHFR